LRAQPDGWLLTRADTTIRLGRWHWPTFIAPP
jgi:hypothetical protein